jgi:signal transduction histidine kinase
MNSGNLFYTERLSRIFRLVGLFIPAILATYGVLIQADVIRTPHAIDDIGLLVLIVWWLFISIIQLLVPSTSRLDGTLRLIIYHILVGAYLVFVSGISSPFIGCWLLLMLASYIHSPRRGIQYSVLSFTLVAGLDIALWYRANPIIFTFDVMALAIILMIGFVTLSISRSQEVNRDELKRSRVQESLQRDRVLTIVNNMTDSVVSTDENGIIQIYNAASMGLLDTNDSLNDHHIDEIFPLIDRGGKNVSLFEQLKKTKVVVTRDDLEYVITEDEKMRLEITYSPIRSSYSRSKNAETHDGYIIILRDVTKSKSLEEEKDEFISVVSHELRTPITIAEGTISNSQLMLDHADVTPAMLKDSLEMAHDQIIFLANMVNDLSALSRAERGVADETEEIDARELAHKLHDKYQKDAEQKGLHLDLDLAPKLGKLQVSRLYIEELLQNFITNSIKYTKEGSITIIVTQKANKITFAVKDTGIGMSKGDQAKIFQKFYRSEDYRTRETGGTGLGLYVAAKLAHKLGAKIEVVSRLNFGSTFSLVLPEAKSEKPTDTKTK